MNEQVIHNQQSAGEIIRERLVSMGISQVELANRCDEHVQVISAILNGQREIPIPLSVKLDYALELEQGSIAVAQARYLAFQEAQNLKIPDPGSRRLPIFPVGR